MTIDDLPKFLTADDLEPFGITPEDVRRRCPHAMAYGPATAPYWLCDDLTPLLACTEGGNEE